MRLTNREIPKEKSNYPYDNKAHGPIDKILKASAFALREDSLIGKHKAYLDQSQRWDLHQLNGPQDL